jgi:hypothetical protein
MDKLRHQKARQPGKESGLNHGSRGDRFFMTRTEAIKQAKVLSKQYKRLFVILDKELNDFFITEREDFYAPDDFYKECNYEIIKVFE